MTSSLSVTTFTRYTSITSSLTNMRRNDRGLMGTPCRHILLIQTQHLCFKSTAVFETRWKISLKMKSCVALPREPEFIALSATNLAPPVPPSWWFELLGWCMQKMWPLWLTLSCSAVMASLAMFTVLLVAVSTRHVMSSTKPSAVRLLSFLVASTLNMKQGNQSYVSP
jgi:hypothetical protein